MPTARYVQRSTIAGVGNGAGGVALSSLRPETVSSTVPELGSQHKQDQPAVVTLGHPKNSDAEGRFADADEDDVEDGNRDNGAAALVSALDMTRNKSATRTDDAELRDAEALVQVRKEQMLGREAQSGNGYDNGTDADCVADAAAAPADAGPANAAAAAALSDGTGIPDDPLPHDFSVEFAKAIVRLQRQIDAGALETSSSKSIGLILGRRHSLRGPILFKDVMELDEVKESTAATEDMTGRMARCEEAVGKKVSGNDIGPHDVLLGRGMRTNLHGGNVTFRRLLGKYKMEYILGSGIVKPDLAREIVCTWRNLEPPGRFLKVQEIKAGCNPGNPDAEIWEDVGNNRAQKKTSQCLRDRSPQIRAAEGIAALFRVGEAEKEEQKRREEEREDRKARQIADIAAYRAQQAAVMPLAYGIPPTFTTMGPYYQQQQPLLKRYITQTTDSPASAQQKRPRLGFPETFATGTNVPGAPLWQQSPPIATAPDVAVGPYNSADVSAQVVAEKERIASLQEKIKLAQVRIDNSHKLIDSTHATKPKTAENPAIPPLPPVNPAIPPPPTVNPAIPPPPTMPQSQIARAPVPVNIPVHTAPPAPHVHVAPMPAMYPAAIAMAMPQAPYPARLPPPPPPHCMYMNSPPAYHPMAHPAGIPNRPAYPVAAGPLHQAHPPPSSLPATTFP